MNARGPMRCLVPDVDPDEFQRLTKRVTEWDLVFDPNWNPESNVCGFGHEHLLGSSRDGRVWAFQTFPTPPPGSPTFGDNTPGPIEALLIDPPEREADTIGGIMFAVHTARLSGRLDTQRVNDILQSAKFPVYRSIGDYLPEAPAGWLHLPGSIGLSIGLSEGACINPTIHEKFERDTLPEVLRVACGARWDGLVFWYSLDVKGVIPMLPWAVDWPLARRGASAPYRRGKVQGLLPSDYETDASLLQIYQSVPDYASTWAPNYFAQPTVRLIVAGRTADEAVSNWHRRARALRKMRRALKAEAQAGCAQ